MKREYPEILNCKREPHQVQFLPDCYLYEELTLKVNYYLYLEPSNNKCLGSTTNLMKGLLKIKKRKLAITANNLYFCYR